MGYKADRMTSKMGQIVSEDNVHQCELFLGGLISAEKLYIRTGIMSGFARQELEAACHFVAGIDGIFANRETKMDYLAIWRKNEKERLFNLRWERLDAFREGLKNEK